MFFNKENNSKYITTHRVERSFDSHKQKSLYREESKSTRMRSNSKNGKSNALSRSKNVTPSS